MNKVEVIRQRFVLEGFGCPYTDTVQCIQFMQALIQVLKMKPIVGPVAVEIPVLYKDIKKGEIKENSVYGVSVGVIFLESSASLHTWPEIGLVCLDIFSCQNYDVKKVEGLFKGYFLPQKVNVVFNDRRK